MRLLAIVFPPLAVLLCGKPIQALLNVFLTALVWLPGVIHAWGVVSDRNADRRFKELARASAAAPPTAVPLTTTTPAVNHVQVTALPTGGYQLVLITTSGQVAPSGTPDDWTSMLREARALADLHRPAIISYPDTTGVVREERVG